MLRCTDVAHALFKKSFVDLTTMQKLKVMTHIVLCPFCGRAHRDLVRNQKVMSGLRDQEFEKELPEDTKAKIQAALLNSQKND